MDPSRDDIIEAAGACLVLHMTWVHLRVAGMTASVDASLAVANAGLGSDTFNTVCRARLGPEDEGRVAETIRYFQDLSQPFSWWVGPGDGPADLDAMLIRAGLDLADSEVAMAAALSDLTHVPVPPGLRIERARSAETLKAFAEVIAANWSPPAMDVIEFYGRATPAFLESGCPKRAYVGYVADEPVATAEVVVSGPCAGLYNVATLPEYRRRGIGMAMTLAALNDARAAGATLGTLQASSQGVGVYERVGFHAFGEYREFKPPA